MDTYFENIQTILIFLKYYCCVSHLKYYKIIFFSWIINKEKYFFISRFNKTSLKETWNKKYFRLCNLLNFILLTSKLLLEKKSRVTFCENSQKKRNIIIEILCCDFDESKSWIFQNRSMLFQDFTSSTFELHEPKTRGKRKV